MTGSLASSRRQFLRRAAGIATVSGIAGCAGDRSGDPGDGTAGDGTTGDGNTGNGSDADGGTGSEPGGSDGTDGDADGSGTTDGVSTSTAAPTTDSNETTTQGDLDLREANVVGLELSSSGGAEIRFDVTLYHDDAGEDGYANWWQVETPAGERLGRRDLAHPHGTTRFTRSTSVEVPDDLDCVVVRGHDQTHGYGGQAMLVTPEGGANRAVRQGSEPQDFGDASCP